MSAEQGVPPIYEPKPVDYSTSYAHAHAALRNAGRVKEAPRRGPQQLPGAKKAAAAAAAADAAASQAAAGDAAPKKPRGPMSGRAVVKSVLSGDTVVLMGGAPAGQIPPERVVALSGIAAPRLQRGKKGQDEPYAYKAREFLRRRLVGQVVQFNVNHVDERSGREYGTIQVDGENAAHMILHAGLAAAKVPAARKDGGTLHPERQALVDLDAAAKEAKRGMWAAPDKTRVTQRKLNWSPDVQKLARENKGKRLPAVVDYVREGHAIRVELTGKQLKHTMLLVYLAGVQCPRLPPPSSDEKPDPAGAYAKSFVEQRLLQRDVEVELHGADKLGNAFATLHFPRGNISVQLLKNGLGKVLSWTAALAPTRDQLVGAEAQAKQARAGLWRNYDPAAEAQRKAAAAAGGAGTVKDQAFAATVVQVNSGDTVTVRDSQGGQARVSLASVLAPRLGNARKGVPDEPWAVEAREWMRKHLIGKRVDVEVEYQRAPRQGSDMPGRTHVSLLQGKSNIAEEMTKAGLVEVVRHRMEEARASNYDRVVQLEESAKERKKGRWSGKEYKPASYVDLTQRGPSAAGENKDDSVKARLMTSKSKTYLAAMEKDRECTGVVEHVFSGSRIKLTVQRHRVKVVYVLAGIRTPPTAAQARRAAAQEKKDGDDSAPAAGKIEPFGDDATELVRGLIQQHDVKIKPYATDKRDNFIGQMYAGDEDLAEMLIRKGLASTFITHSTPEAIATRYRAAEKIAQDNKIGMWVNWVPPPPKEEVVAEEEDVEEEKVFDAKEGLINVMVTEIVSLSDFYAQVVGDKGVEFVTQKMQEFGQNVPAQPANWEAKRGTVCAGQFTDGNWYRVRIDSHTADGDVRAVFVDFGNSDVMPVDVLRPINDEAVKKVPALAHHCTLAGIKGPSKTSEHFDSSLEAFTAYTFERKILGKVLLKDRSGILHLEMHDEASPDSINKLLLREGLARVLARPDRRLKDMARELQAEEDLAKRNRYNLWEYGDVSDDEEEDPKRDDRRGGGRR